MIRDQSPSDVLESVQSRRPIIQDYCPLVESIEWQLGQQYFRERGNKAFLREAEPVPFLINNDGFLSANAADLFYSSVEAADHAQALEEHILVLELGIGIGLFARYFLDRFRELCARSGKDYYDRLCYVAADRSESMLLDAGRHGIFANHAGHYLFRVVDAMEPRSSLLEDASICWQTGRPFRAIFLNYVLDCLPAAILQVNDSDVRQLCIRTCLARGIELSEFTDLGLEEVARRASSNDSNERRDLLSLFGLFASDHAFIALDPNELPAGKFAVDFARSRSIRHVLHSYGASQSLEQLVTVLHTDGFILINDYGHTNVNDAGENYQHNRFSGSTAIGLNFPLLKEYLLTNGTIADWIEPSGDSQGIHHRLLGGRLRASVIERFELTFSQLAIQQTLEPSKQARALVEDGRFEMAASAYRDALRRQPWNWALMYEAATFLSFKLRDPIAGLALTAAALELNPCCSADLWNSLGDCLQLLNRISEAYSSFVRALQVNPDDVRARYNLACIHVARRDHTAALVTIAQGLAIDREEYYRDALLTQQDVVLRRLAANREREGHLTMDRVSVAQDRVNTG